MKHLSVLIASTLFLGLAGCATVQSPVNDVKSGVMATEAYGGSAHGEACATSILGIFASGDASIDAAKKSGNIAQVTVIDHSANNILGLYAKYCTIVYGKKSSSGGSAAPAAKPAG
jgi:hypothetical protein